MRAYACVDELINCHSVDQYLSKMVIILVIITIESLAGDLLLLLIDEKETLVGKGTLNFTQ